MVMCYGDNSFGELGVAMGEERRQANAVVRGPRLFAKRDNAKLLSEVEFDQFFAETQTDHSVANDDNGLAVFLWG